MSAYTCPWCSGPMGRYDTECAPCREKAIRQGHEHASHVTTVDGEDGPVEVACTLADAPYRGPVLAQDVLVGDLLLGTGVSSKVTAVKVGPQMVEVVTVFPGGAGGIGVHRLNEKLWVERARRA